MRVIGAAITKYAGSETNYNDIAFPRLINCALLILNMGRRKNQKLVVQVDIIICFTSHQIASISLIIKSIVYSILYYVDKGLIDVNTN